MGTLGKQPPMKSQYNPHLEPDVANSYKKEASECGLSIRIVKRLMVMGYEDLIVLKGGIARWHRQGYPVVGKVVTREDERREEKQR